MSEGRQGAASYGAAPLIVIIAMLLCAGACGPQTVPFPKSRPAASPGQGGVPIQVPPTQAGQGPRTGAAGVPSVSVGVGPNAGRTGTSTGTAGQGSTPSSPPTGGSTVKPPTAAEGGGTLAPFDAGSDPNRNHATPGGLCKRLAQIQCAAEAHCCTSPGRSVAECESALSVACNEQLYLDAIASNRITGFDPDATAEAFTELETRSAQCDIEIAAWIVSPQGIRRILKGTVEAGGNCKPSTAALTQGDKAAQAASVASCLNSETTACLPKSALGAWTCAPKNQAGGTCLTDDNCAGATYCSTPNGSALGRCTQRVALNGSCSGANECETLYCSGGRCVPPSAQVAFCLK